MRRPVPLNSPARTTSVSRRVERLLDGGNDFALRRKGAPRNARASRRRVAAPAELRGNGIHIHLLALRAQADAGQLRVYFLEHARDHHRGDGADVVDQALRVAALGAGAGEVGFLEPEVGDLILVGQMEVAVDVPQQPGAGEWIRLVHLVADLSEVSAAADELARDVIGPGARAGILKGAGVGGDGGEEAVGNALGDRPLGNLQQPEDEFPRRRLVSGDPVQVGVARVALVVVDVNEELVVAKAPPARAEAVEGGRVGGYDAVELHALLGLLDDAVPVEELVFLRDAIFVPASDFLAFGAEREREAEL